VVAPLFRATASARCLLKIATLAYLRGYQNHNYSPQVLIGGGPGFKCSCKAGAFSFAENPGRSIIIYRGEYMRESSINDALHRIYPQSAVLVVSVDGEGNPNAMVADWHMRTSFNPPLYAVSVGKTRYTHELIKICREFVIAFPSSGIKNQTLYCGIHSGREGDKLEAAGLKTLPAKNVKPPLIEGCAVCLECRVVEELDTGDHTIFVGEIVAAHTSEGKILFDFGGHELKEI